MRRPFHIALVTLLFMTAACAPNHDKKKESSYSYGFRLIDAQKDDQAIDYFTRLCRSSKDRKCLVALASAYAHKAGIKIQKFVSVITTTKHLGQIDLSVKINATSSESSLKVNSLANGVADALMRYAKVLKIYAAIPTVTQENAIYLREAVRILAGIEKPRPGDAIYRAVLRIIMLKYDFADEITSEGENVKLDSQCRMDIQKTNNHLQQFNKDILAIYDDFIIAEPAKRKAFENLKRKTVEGTYALTTFVSSLNVTDEASAMLFKRQLIAQGLGKVIQCQGGPSAL